MTNTENTALQMIAEARCPDYGPDMVKALMEKLDMNEKGFALLMNVAPSTVRLWTSGAAQPCGTAKRLMQIYETGPEIVGKIAGGQAPADGSITCTTCMTAPIIRRAACLQTMKIRRIFRTAILLSTAITCGTAPCSPR